MKFDLHIHTGESSDSPETLGGMIEAAKNAGLDGIAVTNHDVFTPLPKCEDFILIPACEYTTDGGHLLTYFISKSLSEGLLKDEKGRYSWRDIISRAHGDGGLVFLAHPYSPEIPRTDELLSQIDGIECYNARIEHSRSRGANMRAADLAKALKKPMSAGSDAHYASEVGAAYIECEITAESYEERLAELYSALKDGRGRVYGGTASPIWKIKSGWLKTFRLKDWRRIPFMILRSVRGIVLSLNGSKVPQYIDSFEEESKN